MRDNKRVGMSFLAGVVMVLLMVPVIHVAAGCFTGCGPTPPPPPLMPAIETPPPVNMDTTISFNDSDLGVVLYKTQDETGHIKMDVYGLKNGEKVSGYLFSISQDDLASFVHNPPAKNTMLAEASNVSVYVLTTGEIQINAGPDSEGKMHVKILNGIPWSKVYGYTVDAQ